MLNRAHIYRAEFGVHFRRHLQHHFQPHLQSSLIESLARYPPDGKAHNSTQSNNRMTPIVRHPNLRIRRVNLNTT